MSVLGPTDVPATMPLDADRVRIARELLGYSQERLAWSAGVPVKAVQTLEMTGLVRAVDEQRLTVSA